MSVRVCVRTGVYVTVKGKEALNLRVSKVHTGRIGEKKGGYYYSLVLKQEGNMLIYIKNFKVIYSSRAPGAAVMNGLLPVPCTYLSQGAATWNPRERKLIGVFLLSSDLYGYLSYYQTSPDG